MAPSDTAAVNDSFSVLLRYADATGEKVRNTVWDNISRHLLCRFTTKSLHGHAAHMQARSHRRRHR